LWFNAGIIIVRKVFQNRCSCFLRALYRYLFLLPTGTGCSIIAQCL